MYINTQTSEYPVTEAQIRALSPNTSFSHPFVAPEPFAVVFPTPVPPWNPLVEMLAEGAPVLTDKGHYEQQWVVTDMSTEDRAAHTAGAIKVARARALDRVNLGYSAQAATLAAGYPEEEQKSWPVQILEANAVLAGLPEADTPWITAAAPARGISREAMAQLIRDQDTAYRQYHGMLSGQRQALRNKIQTAPETVASIAALDAVQWPGSVT